jgi:hypothetical protein
MIYSMTSVTQGIMLYVMTFLFFLCHDFVLIMVS